MTATPSPPPVLGDSPHGSRDPAVVGAACALGAFLVWGLVPIYFKAIAHVPPLEVVTHRVVWSVLLLAAIVAALGRLKEVRLALAAPGRLKAYLTTTLLISSNWLVFIHAIDSNQLVQVSLGYYINPLINVLLGVAFLGETLGRRRRQAVAVAAAGVAILILDHGSVPWLSLFLGASFGLYALVRKKAAIDPLVGLLIETLLLAPLAAGWLLWLEATGQSSLLAAGRGQTVLLLLSGVITAIPLILFMEGARRLALSTIGLMQYLAPSCHLMLGVLVYGEPFGWPQGAAFGTIWLALGLLSAEAVSAHRLRRRRQAGP